MARPGSLRRWGRSPTGRTRGALLDTHPFRKTYRIDFVLPRLCLACLCLFSSALIIIIINFLFITLYM